MYFLHLFIIPLIYAEWSFMHMADWGGDDAPRFTKSSQCAAGNAMEDIAKKYNVDTILALGDNFYHNGVTFDDAASYFKHTFDEVYNGPTLNKAKFYAVAGNHDHRGDVDAQINFPLEKWYFPDHWYTFTKDIGHGMTAQFIMIDTVLLVGESYHDIENNVFVSATGPKNLQRAKSQWSFIEKELSQSTADFLFVAGHYPVYSPCSHGSTTDLINHLKPLLERFEVTAYISGHDHCASYVDEGLGPVYPMNGMGDTCCYHAKKLKGLQGLVGNDLHFYVSKDNAKEYGKPHASFNSYTLHHTGEMQIRYHDETGKVFYQTNAQSRRVSRLYSTLPWTDPSTLDVSQLVIIGVSACIFGFFATWCCSRRRKNGPQDFDDILLDSTPGDMSRI